MKILFELEAISHIVSEMSGKLSSILRLTGSESSPLAEKQRAALEALDVWKELFSQTTHDDETGNNNKDNTISIT